MMRAPAWTSPDSGSILAAASNSFSAWSSRSAFIAQTACVMNSSRNRRNCSFAIARARSAPRIAGASFDAEFCHWCSIAFRKKLSASGFGRASFRVIDTLDPLTRPATVAVSSPRSAFALPTTRVARSARSGGRRVGNVSTTSFPNATLSARRTGTSNDALRAFAASVRAFTVERSSLTRTTAPPVRVANPCRLCGWSLTPIGTAKKAMSLSASRLPRSVRTCSVSGVLEAADSPSPRYRMICCRPLPSNWAADFSSAAFRSTAPEPYSLSARRATATATASEFAGLKPCVRERVAEASSMLAVQTSNRSSGPASLASVARTTRARLRFAPAWLADVSTMTRTSRGRAGAAARAGFTCHAKTVSPDRSLYASAGELVNLVRANSSAS